MRVFSDANYRGREEKDYSLTTLEGSFENAFRLGKDGDPMKDLADLAEAILTYSAVYLTTLWDIVFNPTRVFHPTVPNSVCPPAIAFTFTIVLVYYGMRVAWPKEAWKSMPLELDEKGFLALAAAYVAIIANMERWAIARATDMSGIPFQTQLGALVYTFCPAYLLTLLLVVTIKSRIFLLSCLFIQGVYIWCLVGMFRGTFGLSGSQVIKCTLYAYGAFLLGAVLLLGVSFVVMLAQKNWASSPVQKAEKA